MASSSPYGKFPNWQYFKIGNPMSQHNQEDISQPYLTGITKKAYFMYEKFQGINI
jgi:hypothetical protein